MTPENIEHTHKIEKNLSVNFSRPDRLFRQLGRISKPYLKKNHGRFNHGNHESPITEGEVSCSEKNEYY